MTEEKQEEPIVDKGYEPKLGEKGFTCKYNFHTKDLRLYVAFALTGLLVIRLCANYIGWDFLVHLVVVIWLWIGFVKTMTYRIHLNDKHMMIRKSIIRWEDIESITYLARWFVHPVISDIAIIRIEVDNKKIFVIPSGVENFEYISKIIKFKAKRASIKGF